MEELRFEATEAMAGSHKHASERQPGGRKIRVLVVEDSALDSEMLARELKRAGFECEWKRVETEPEFLAELATRPDLILSDFSLPRFSGLRAAELLREQGLDIPFILISGSVGEEAAVEAMKLGAADYLLKDRIARLGYAVANALEEKQLRDDRRRAEEALRESEERYRDLFENASDLIFTISPEGRLLFANQACWTSLGFSQSEMREKVLFDLIHPDERSAYRRQIEGILRGESGKLVELELASKSGERILLEGSITVKADNGELPTLRCIFRNVTEKRALEAQAYRNQRLESLGALAGGIAHDLNNILSPILMSVQMLRMRFGGGENLRILETLETSARRGAEMVKQILAFSRGVEGKRTDVEVGPLVSEMKTIVRDTFPKSIDLRIEIPPEVWTIFGDATQLHQVLLNLCVNARDAMPQGGILTIRCENVFVDDQFASMHVDATPGPHVLIRIADTGIGIPPEVRHRIFEPFFTTKPPDKGTGLGLSTVRTIVKGHRGFIGVSSEPGKGSEFRVYLPAGRKSESAAAQPELPKPVFGSGELLLIADDEAAIRDITRQTLELFGYRVVTAADGTQAVELLAQHRNELKLMITDLEMPVMNGASAARAARIINPEIKLIVTSGRTGDTALDSFDQLHPAAVILKPFTADRLLKAVHDALCGGGEGN